MHPSGPSMTRIKTPIISRYAQKIVRYMELGADGKLEELWNEVRPLFIHVAFFVARVNTHQLVCSVQNGSFRVDFWVFNAVGTFQLEMCNGFATDL